MNENIIKKICLYIISFVTVIFFVPLHPLADSFDETISLKYMTMNLGEVTDIIHLEERYNPILVKWYSEDPSIVTCGDTHPSYGISNILSTSTLTAVSPGTTILYAYSVTDDKILERYEVTVSNVNAYSCLNQNFMLTAQSDTEQDYTISTDAPNDHYMCQKFSDTMNETVIYYKSYSFIIPEPGTWTITLTGLDDLTVRTYTVVVASKHTYDNRTCIICGYKEPCPFDDLSYYLNDDMDLLHGVAPDTTLKQFLANANSSLWIYDQENQEVTAENAVLGTNYTVVFWGTDLFNVMRRITYTLSIKGDCSGDGIINVMDMECIQKHILGINTLSKASLSAGLLSGKSTSLSVLDMEIVQKHILGITMISQ